MLQSLERAIRLSDCQMQSVGEHADVEHLESQDAVAKVWMALVIDSVHFPWTGLCRFRVKGKLGHFCPPRSRTTPETCQNVVF